MMDNTNKENISDDDIKTMPGWDVLSSYIDAEESGKEDSSDGESIEVIEREENDDKMEEKSPAVSSDEKEAVEEEVVVNAENDDTERSIGTRHERTPSLHRHRVEYRIFLPEFTTPRMFDSVYTLIYDSLGSTYFRAAVTTLLAIILLLNHTAHIRDQEPNNKLNDYIKGIKSEKVFTDIGFDDVIQNILDARVLGKHYVINLEHMIKNQFSTSYKRSNYKIAPFELPFAFEEINEIMDKQTDSYFRTLSILNEYFRMSVIDSLMSKTTPSDRISNELQVLLMNNKAILQSEIRRLKFFNPIKEGRYKTIEEIVAEKRETLSVEERATLYEKYMLEGGYPKLEQQGNNFDHSYTTYLSKKLDEIESKMKEENEVEEIQEEEKDEVEDVKEEVKQPTTPAKAPKIYNFGGLFNTTEMIPLCGLSEQLGFDMPDCDTNEPYTILSSPSPVKVYHFNYDKDDTPQAPPNNDMKIMKVMKVISCMVDSLKENFVAIMKKYGLDNGVPGIPGKPRVGRAGRELGAEEFLNVLNTLNKLVQSPGRKFKELRGNVDENSWKQFLETNFPNIKVVGAVGFKWHLKFKETNSEEVYEMLMGKDPLRFTVNLEKTPDQLIVTIQRHKKGFKKFTDKLKDGYVKIATKFKDILYF